MKSPTIIALMLLLQAPFSHGMEMDPCTQNIALTTVITAAIGGAAALYNRDFKAYAQEEQQIKAFHNEARALKNLQEESALIQVTQSRRDIDESEKRAIQLAKWKFNRDNNSCWLCVACCFCCAWSLSAYAATLSCSSQY